MFPDNNQQQSAQDPATSGGYPAPAPLSDPFGASQPAPYPAPATDPFSMATPSVPPVTDTGSAPAPVAPVLEPAQSNNDSSASSLGDAALPDFLQDSPSDNTNSTDSSTQTPSSAPPINHAELTDMKQQVISQLQPLVNHLDQSAEDQFKTTMMLIQATDDHTLLKNAFETAKKIEDDKSRAQALLDVINEINYFTQSQDTDS